MIQTTQQMSCMSAPNEHCDEWNARRLALLPGTVSTSVASDGKKDDCAQLATANMPE